MSTSSASRSQSFRSFRGGHTFRTSSESRAPADSPSTGTPQSVCQVEGVGNDEERGAGRGPANSPLVSHNDSVVSETLPRCITLSDLTGKQSVLDSIEVIIKGNFHGPWTTYTQVPLEVRERWWNLFKLRYTWLPGENAEETYKKMKSTFHSRGSHWFSKTMMTHRNKNVRPDYVSEANWGVMLQYWASPEFAQKSQKSRINRSTEKAKQRQYYGGRLSVSEHVKKMEEEEKVVPTQLKIINRLFVKKGSEPSTEVAEIKARYKEKLIQKRQESGSGSNSVNLEDIDDEELEDDPRLYEEVVGKRKNRIFGQGCQARVSSASISSEGATYEDFGARRKRELEQLKAQFEEEKAEMKREYQAQANDLLMQFQGLKDSISQLSQGIAHGAPSYAARPSSPLIPRSPTPLANPGLYFSSPQTVQPMMPFFPQQPLVRILPHQIPENNQNNNCDGSSF